MAARFRIALAALMGVSLALLVALPVGVAGANSTIVWSRFPSPKKPKQVLVSARPNGHDLRTLTHPSKDYQDNDGQISPDGSQVIFERDPVKGDPFNGGPPVFTGIVDSDGQNEQILDLGCTDPCVLDSAPTWTPTAGRIAYSPVVGPLDAVNDSAHSAVLQTSALDGSDPMRLSEAGIDGIYEDYHAHYSPDGSYIIFTRVRNADIKAAAFRMDVDGTNEVQLTPWKLGGDLADLSPAPSGPTKDLVVFETYGTGAPKGKNQNIATVPTTCGSTGECKQEITYLTHRGAGPRASFNPAWSPNGTKVAYTEFSVENKNGKCCVGDIWKMRADGSHKKPVSESKTFEYRPDWGVAAP